MLMLSFFVLLLCDVVYGLLQFANTYTGHSPGQAKGLADCGHSKIVHVHAYYVLYVVAHAD